MSPTLEAFYAYWAEWFAQPLPEKMKLSKEVTGKSGYMPFASESPGFTGQKDPKQYFHWKAWDFDHPGQTKGLDGSPTHDLFFECYGKAIKWLIDRDLTEVVKHVRASDCVLRIIHYPAHPTGCVGEAHRDFDLLTVSVEGTAPGLEVWSEDCDRSYCNKQHGWIPQETGIQVGEMLEIYTNNFRSDWDPSRRQHLQATTHRVRTPPNTDRLKAVFFYLPPMGFELRPGFTAHDYLLKPGSGVLLKAGTSK